MKGLIVISIVFLYVETYVESINMSPQGSFLINSLLKISCIITLNTPVGPGILPNVTWYHNMTNITHNSSILMRNNDTVFTSTLTIHLGHYKYINCFSSPPAP